VVIQSARLLAVLGCLLATGISPTAEAQSINACAKKLECVATFTGGVGCGGPVGSGAIDGGLGLPGPVRVTLLGTAVIQ
jgi:hypothetical protein